MEAFDKLIKPFCGSGKIEDGMIQEDELETNQERTWKNLNLAEKLQQFSAKSDLIVV